jgi:hypothetical protein
MKQALTYLADVLSYCWTVALRALHNAGDAVVEQYGWVVLVVLIAFIADNHAQLPSWFSAIRKRRWRDVMAEKRWRNLNFRRTAKVAGCFFAVFLIGAGFEIDKDRKIEIEQLVIKIKELTP